MQVLYAVPRTHGISLRLANITFKFILVISDPHDVHGFLEAQVLSVANVNLCDSCKTKHHDLRHLFATRCIENGVDIPTVSRWLGHQDGGALCMKTDGHLRDEHSANEAKKVTF
jgi:integrase